MREHGVEVFEAGPELLAQALAKPEARDWVCGHILNERQVGITAAQPAPRVGWIGRTGGGGGVPDRRDHQGRRAPGRGTGVRECTTGTPALCLPPLPNFSSSGTRRAGSYDGVTLNPMTSRPKPETMIMETVYRFHPMFAAEKFPVWLGGADEDWGAATSRAATYSRSATAR